MSAEPATEGVAADELRQFAGADWRKRMDALWGGIAHSRGCIEYCVERTLDLCEARNNRAATVLRRSGDLMGVRSDRARHIAQLIKRKGGYDAAQSWLAQPPAIMPLDVPGPQLDLIGFVYTARVVPYPHILKIGFSKSPSRRMKELEVKFGHPMALIDIKVGTILDEARAHYDAGRKYIAREFVFAPEFDDVRPSQIPHFLLDPAFAHISEV